MSTPFEAGIGLGPALERMRAVGAAQHEVVLTEQLGEAGIGLARRRRLVAQGWLVPVARGALIVGGGAPTAWQRLVAVWLLAGPGAVVSHSSAARIHRLYCAASLPHTELPEVAVLRPSHRRPAGCWVHRVSSFQEGDVVQHRGLAVTSPLRTLVDLAPRLTAGVLEKTVDEGIVGRLWTAPDLAVAVDRATGRPAVDRLRTVVDARSGGPSRVDSHLEMRAARALACLAPFETQFEVVVGGRVYLLDFAWPRYRVAVECDGWEVRSRSRGKFDHDRRRGNLLASHGWTVVRLTSAMSEDEMRAAVVAVLLRTAEDRG